MKNYENNYKDTKFAQRNKGIIFVQKESNKLKKNDNSYINRAYFIYTIILSYQIITNINTIKYKFPEEKLN